MRCTYYKYIELAQALPANCPIRPPSDPPSPPPKKSKTKKQTKKTALIIEVSRCGVGTSNFPSTALHKHHHNRPPTVQTAFLLGELPTAIFFPQHIPSSTISEQHCPAAPIHHYGQHHIQGRPTVAPRTLSPSTVNLEVHGWPLASVPCKSHVARGMSANSACVSVRLVGVCIVGSETSKVCAEL